MMNDKLAQALHDVCCNELESIHKVLMEFYENLVKTYANGSETLWLCSRCRQHK